MALHLTFSNGRTIVVQVGDLPASIIGDALMHGLKQKLVDAAAMSRNPDTGRAASIDDKYNAVAEVADRLMVGQWNKVREGGATGTLLFRALCQLYEGKKDPDAIQAYLDGKTDAEKAALKKNPKVAAIIIELQAAKAGDIDTDELLGELDD